MADEDVALPGDAQGAEDDDASEPDETLKERLWGLTEMFPDEIVEKVVDTADTVVLMITRVYKMLRTGTWILVTSALILLAPIYFECTRLAYEKSQEDRIGGPCMGKQKLMRKPGSHPCQPFRPHPQQKDLPPPPPKD